MRYDDPLRPLSDVGATKSLLQTNGSPLPVITLMYPMTNGDDVWGWLACIHAHRASNRFGTYYAWLRDLGAFQQDYMEDPENALRMYFKYNGPEYETTDNAPRATKEITDDIFS